MGEKWHVQSLCISGQSRKEVSWNVTKCNETQPNSVIHCPNVWMFFSWNVLGCGEGPDTRSSVRHDLLSCREMVGLGPSRAEQEGKFAPKLRRKTLHWAWTRKWGFMVLGENIQHKLGAKCRTFLIIYHFCFEINLAKSFHSNSDIFLSQQQRPIFSDNNDPQ